MGLLDFMQLVQAGFQTYRTVQFSHRDIGRHPAVTGY